MSRVTAILLTVPALLHAGQSQPRTRWSGPQVNLLGSPSRDGATLSFADPATGALAIRDLAAGSSRAIATRPPGTKEFAYFSVFSRDGLNVAFAWFNSQGFYDLRLVPADAKTKPRVLFSNEDAGFVQPCAWTPDGKQILTLLFRRDNISQIVLIPTAGGPPHVLRSLNWVYPKKMDLSPDGRWIVYDNFAEEGRPERAIFVLSMDGTAESRLTEPPGNCLFPLWSPDGSRIVFACDSGGPPELWSVEMENGRRKSEARPISGALGRFLPLGFSSAGELFYGVRTGATDVYLARPNGDKIEVSATPSRYLGRNSAPAWSGDGAKLAYLSRRGVENFGENARSIVTLDLVSGRERDVAAPLASIARLAWSPEGASLLASGSDGKGRSGLFLVRAEDGHTTPVVAERDASLRDLDAVWAADGRSVYYLHGDNELRCRSLADGSEATILRGEAMRKLAISPQGDFLAIGIGGSAIRLTPLTTGAAARLVSFPGLTELAWGNRLYAGRGTELWAVPLDGAGPRRIALPNGCDPGFSVNARDESIAFTAGREQAEVRSIRVFAETLRVPLGLDAYVPMPDLNPLTKEKVSLGRKLFFDTRLSRDGSMSCATCHRPDRAYTDANQLAIGIGGQTGNRRVPRLVNRAYGRSFFWDGRAATLEDQVLQPIGNPKEMGISGEQAARRVGIAEADLRDALAAFVRTILSGNAPYDRYMAGDAAALTGTERAGLRLFSGKAGCSTCHLGPNLTDEQFHNTGAGGGGDPGRTGGTFKTPSLREAARAAPYMHDGSLATLEAVIDFYNEGGKTNPNLDPEIRPLHLTPDEKAALASFLRALNGEMRDGL